MASKTPATTTSPVKLEIISLGLARTGSLSMSLALKQLGFDPVYHSVESTFHRPADASIWLDVIRKKYNTDEPITKSDLDRATAGLRAVTSAPYWAFGKELMTAYPDAKVILVEREYDRWMESFIPIVSAFMYSWRGWILYHVVQPILGRKDVALMRENMFGYFDAPTLDAMKRNARQVHREHHDGIRNFAKERNIQLLDYKLGDGWGPLCEFLDVSVPDGVEFPRGNERAKLVGGIEKGFDLQTWQAVGVVGRWCLAGGVVGAVACAVWMGWDG